MTGAKFADRRQTTTIDLGALRPRVTERCAASGEKASTWIRGLIERELDLAPRSPAREIAPGNAYRPWLDEARVARLDQLVGEGRFRSRATALRALIDGVDVSAGGRDLGSAVDALGRSTSELAALGRNLNQVARSLNAFPGRTTPVERAIVAETCRSVEHHLDVAARLMAQVRPLLHKGVRA